MLLSDVCLSVVHIGPNWRTDRPINKTKIGPEVAHVTCESDTTFKVKRWKVKVTRPLYSPQPYRVRQLQRWAWERIGRGELLLRLCARRSYALRRPQRAGHIVAAARLQLVINTFNTRVSYATACEILFDSHFTQYIKQETQLSMTNRATHLCKRNGLADFLEHLPHMLSHRIWSF